VVIFLGLFVLMAQIAPVVLFPIFYKFSPLDNDELKRRLVKLGNGQARRFAAYTSGSFPRRRKRLMRLLPGWAPHAALSCRHASAELQRG